MEKTQGTVVGTVSPGNLSLLIRGALIQFKKLWKTLLLLYLPISLLFLMMYLVSRSFDHLSLSDFSYDITVLGDLPFYAGMLSQLGIMLWSAAAAVCLFSVVLLRGQDAGIAKRFLIHAAVLTTILLLDDTFLFHEDIGPNYLGISQKIVFLFYFALGLVFLFSNIGEILNSEYLILGLAMALFGTSVFFDEIHLDRYYQYGTFFSERVQTFIEDGFKFAGIATWLAYFTRYTLQKLRGDVVHVQAE